MTLVELAATIGVTHPYLSDVERGKRPVNARVQAAYDAIADDGAGA